MEQNTTLRYVRMNPTGNITLLAQGEDLRTAADLPKLADRLMQQEPGAEQVGFLYPPDEDGAEIILRMAGGEFCGNATLSAAAIAARRQALEEGTIRVKASGADGPVSVAIRRIGENRWKGSVNMPQPQSITQEVLPEVGRMPVVRFPGIAHVICDRLKLNDKLKDKLKDKLHDKLNDKPNDGQRSGIRFFTRPDAERLAPEWCRALHADAVGLMFLSEDCTRLDPLVYVPSADTLFWESSCASGTTAVGAWLYQKAGKPAESVRASLRQPGGTLTVEADSRGCRLEGTVTLERESMIPEWVF